MFLRVVSFCSVPFTFTDNNQCLSCGFPASRGSCVCAGKDSGELGLTPKSVLVVCFSGLHAATITALGEIRGVRMVMTWVVGLVFRLVCVCWPRPLLLGPAAAAAAAEAAKRCSTLVRVCSLRWFWYLFFHVVPIARTLSLVVV